MKFKKSTNVKYPWVVGPFTLKSKKDFPSIKNLLNEMGFPTDPVVDYDSHQVISNRRKVVKRNPFNHVEVVGLEDVANWDDYPKETPKDTNLHKDSGSFVKDST